MKLIICAYNRLKICHTIFWSELIDILVCKYDFKLIDITPEAKRIKRNSNLKISLANIINEYENITEIFFFNLTIFLSQLFYDLTEVKGIKLYLWIEEIWHHYEEQNECIKYCSKIFTPSPKKNMLKYLNITNQQIYELGYSSSKIFDLKINNNPINKILFFGTISDVYPHRVKINKLCNNEQRYNEIIDILPKFEMVNEKIAKHINKYKATIATPGIVDNDYFIVKKFFEISLTGSLLLIYSDKNSKTKLDNIGFKNNENCIICYNEQEFKQAIDYILNDCNIEKINTIRKNGKKLSINNYTTENISKKIMRYLN